MDLLILPEVGDGRPYGTVTVEEDGLAYVLDEGALEEVEALIEESVKWTTKELGGAPPDSACGGVGPEVTMSDHQQIMQLAFHLPREAPVRVEWVVE